jgi:Kef-type K+ transport system membrane component KefB/Trk K+ transport system NAD-binding subunit
MEVLIELGIIIAITVFLGFIMRLLKQPLIIGYIISGIIVGPYLLNIASSTGTMNLFAHMGIALLLFIVGLNLNPKIIKDVGKVSLITGLGQVIFTSAIGFVISFLFGFSVISSLYIAVALTFSSTIIIMKLLSDKSATGTLYGKISIGFLIVQDIVAMLILMIISSIPEQAGGSNLIFQTIALGIFAFVGVILFGIFLLPKITKAIAKCQELLLLFSISWCFLISALFYSLNFSMEIGALVAGVTLSLSHYRYEISSKMRPLRDFFVILFFVVLGSQMVFANISQYLIPIIIFSLFILIGNPLIVLILMGLLGYTKRNGFMAGLTVAQISEFSLILITLGVKVGHLSDDILSMVTVIGLITIAGSSYMIMHSNKLYSFLSKSLKIFEKKGKKIDEHKYHKDENYDIFLFGYNRIGYDLLKSFKRNKSKFLVVDYDPETIINLAKEGVDCRYGDASDFELLNELNLSKAKMIYSTIPDFDTNIVLISKIKEVNKNAIIIVISHQIEEAIKLYDQGATYVIMPHFLGGHHASTLIEQHGFNVDKFLEEKFSHIRYLKERRKKGHEHPVMPKMR